MSCRTPVHTAYRDTDHTSDRYTDLSERACMGRQLLEICMETDMSVGV